MDDELALVSRILSGDQEAWREFNEEYSPLLQRTIARYVRDDETGRDLYATLLQKLKAGKLERFDFRSKLSTWLFVVARNHCRDYYRSTKGVRYLMKALEGLGATERRFFDLYYVQRLTLPQVFESMRLERGGSFSYLDISACLEKIDATLKRKKLGKILDKLLRPDVEFVPGSEQIIESRIEAPALSPETIMGRESLREAIDNLRTAMLRLPHRDRLVLQLRFEHKLSARKISQILDMGNEKQVYRKLDRLYEELKSMLLDGKTGRANYYEVVEDIEYLCRLNALCENRLIQGGDSVS